MQEQDTDTIELSYSKLAARRKPLIVWIAIETKQGANATIESRVKVRSLGIVHTNGRDFAQQKHAKLTISKSRRVSLGTVELIQFDSSTREAQREAVQAEIKYLIALMGIVTLGGSANNSDDRKLLLSSSLAEIMADIAHHDPFTALELRIAPDSLPDD